MRDINSGTLGINEEKNKGILPTAVLRNAKPDKYYSKDYTEEKIMELNSRLVAKLAWKYLSQNYEFDDLYDIGRIGLIKAIRTFDESKGNKFATYASICVINEIFMHFRKENKEKECTSLDNPLSDDGESNGNTFSYVMGSDRYMIEEEIIESEQLECFSKHLQGLGERQKKILKLKLEGNTQDQIAGELNISRSYVSKLEGEIIQEVKRGIVGELGADIVEEKIAIREIDLECLNPELVKGFLEKYVYARELPNDGIITIDRFLEIVSEFSKSEINVLVLTHGLIRKEMGYKHVAEIVGVESDTVKAVRKGCITKLQDAIGLKKVGVGFEPLKRTVENKVDPTTLPSEINRFYLPIPDINAYLEGDGTKELKPQGNVEILKEPTLDNPELVKELKRRAGIAKSNPRVNKESGYLYKLHKAAEEESKARADAQEVVPAHTLGSELDEKVPASTLGKKKKGEIRQYLKRVLPPKQVDVPQIEKDTRRERLAKYINALNEEEASFLLSLMDDHGMFSEDVDFGEKVPPIWAEYR